MCPVCATSLDYQRSSWNCVRFIWYACACGGFEEGWDNAWCNYYQSYRGLTAKSEKIDQLGVHALIVEDVNYTVQEMTWSHSHEIHINCADQAATEGSRYSIACSVLSLAGSEVPLQHLVQELETEEANAQQTLQFRLTRTLHSLWLLQKARADNFRLRDELSAVGKAGIRFADDVFMNVTGHIYIWRKVQFTLASRPSCCTRVARSSSHYLSIVLLAC